MKRILSILTTLFLTLTVSAQLAIGEWRTHFAYNKVTLVQETPTKIFGVSEGELYYFDKEDGGYGLINKSNGLSDSGIERLAYSSEMGLLVVGYSNGNIDLIGSDGVVNIPEVKNKILSADKRVNQIYAEGGEAYFSYPFGVVVVNLHKGEVKESYIFNESVTATTVADGYLYVARTSGLYRGRLSDNLLDGNNWVRESMLNASHLVTHQRNVVALVRNNGVYTRNENGWVYLNDLGWAHTLKSEGGLLCYLATTQVMLFENLSSGRFVAVDGVTDISALSGDELYLAQASKGVNSLEQLSSGEWSYVSQNLQMEGPSTNNSFSMHVAGNRIYAVGGGRWGNNEDRPAKLFYFDANQWRDIPVPTQLESLQTPSRDLIRVIANPKDNRHLYVASWGEGVYEFKNEELVKIYNSELGNSSLQSIFPGQAHAKNYNRVDGFAYDKKGFLYMTNTQVSRAISVLAPDGKWSSLTYSQLAGKGTIGEILIARNGFKWVVIPRPGGERGIFVFDDKSTLDNAADDQSRFFSSFNDQDGKLFNPTFYYCMVEDLDGKIWIGTELGPLTLNSPSRAFDSNFSATRVKVPRRDGTNQADYLLEYVPIKAIAIDGGNRKWFGTEGSGVYLISADGQESIHHFTAENSILPSNNVISIAVHPTTGEVFFGTDKGIVSYRDVATQGSSTYNEVYTFPNPVRPDYDGVVTVTGLMAESMVKITDINNHLMAEGSSIGGQFTWNQTNLRGDRVASGIYLVYASSKEGSSGVVTKILIVR